MPQILHLEYACTDAEMEQAQTLSLRKRLGGGSKWRTRLVLLFVLVGMLLGAWFQLSDIPEGYRALMIAAVFGCGYLFVLCKRKCRKTVLRPIKLEVSERDFTVLGPASKVTIPWSAFGECLESADLFVLLDRPKRTLIVVPKRAFPGERWQTWFREQAANGPSLTTPAWGEMPALAPSTSSGRITFTFQLGFRDYLVRTVASWRTWGICLGLACILLGIALYSAAHPPPRAVNSSTKVFFTFMFPFLLVCVTMIILIFSVHGWLLHAKYNGPQDIALTEVSVEFAATDGSGTVPWTSYKHFKETLWSFIIWRGAHWIMFPKRAFASREDESLCRDLLDRNLKRSRWFLG